MLRDGRLTRPPQHEVSERFNRENPHNGSPIIPEPLSCRGGCGSSRLEAWARRTSFDARRFLRWRYPVIPSCMDRNRSLQRRASATARRRLCAVTADESSSAHIGMSCLASKVAGQTIVSVPTTPGAIRDRRLFLKTPDVRRDVDICAPCSSVMNPVCVRLRC